MIYRPSLSAGSVLLTRGWRLTVDFLYHSWVNTYMYVQQEPLTSKVPVSQCLTQS